MVDTYRAGPQTRFDSSYTEMQRLLSTLDTEVRNGRDPLALQTLVEQLQGQLPEVKEGLDDIVRRAERDPLTKLPTRKASERIFLEEYSRTQRSDGGRIGLWVWDVDNLHDVNKHGYAIGDKLIRTVANAIKESSRPHDRHVRFGGDEVVTYSTDAKDPEGFKQRVQGNVERKRIIIPTINFAEQGLQGHPVGEDDTVLYAPGISVGYATLEVERTGRLNPEEIEELHKDLLERADRNMKEDKKARERSGKRIGRNGELPFIHVPSGTVRTL